jgi:hypothetical protein
MHYKFIDLPNVDKIQEQILRNLPQDLKSRTLYMTFADDAFKKCVPLVHAVETIKPWSEIDVIGLMVCMPHANIPIHTDLGKIIETKYSLNIPIYNCDRPYTSFYKPLEGTAQNIWVLPDALPSGDDQTLSRYHENDVQEIARMHLYKPAFFNTQIPHGIINPTDDVRIVVSIRFSTPFDLSKFN